MYRVRARVRVSVRDRVKIMVGALVLWITFMLRVRFRVSFIV